MKRKGAGRRPGRTRPEARGNPPSAKEVDAGRGKWEDAQAHARLVNGQCIAIGLRFPPRGDIECGRQAMKRAPDVKAVMSSPISPAQRPLRGSSCSRRQHLPFLNVVDRKIPAAHLSRNAYT